ncbi:MAG TPA: hypothetical protein VE174_09410 [Actinomycetota bacterium]|nr:hypothetical protein [Actinomycetota bacterium]
MTTRTVRTVAIMGAAALLLGAFASGPAVAKKKKKKKKAPVAACAPFAPGEKGAGQPVTVVTDAATAEAPVEVTVATDPGLGFSSEAGEGAPEDGEGLTSHAYTNVQIDSAAPSAGLYVRVEFEPVWDYDLWLRDSGHSALAYAAGSSPAPVPGVTDGTGNGGHTESGSENIDGYFAADCNGFTVDIANAGGPGGDVVVKYWLGEPAG